MYGLPNAMMMPCIILNNGEWHKIWLRFSSTERIFMYDDNVYKYIVDATFDHVQYYGLQYRLNIR